MQPHLYCDDIIYHKYDPELKLDFTKKLESIHYSACSVSSDWGHGVELTQTGFAKKLAGKLFTTESGIDACDTFTNFGIIRDRITYILKYHKNVCFGKQSFQVRGEHLTLFDFIEKQTLEKRCFVS